MSREVEVDEFFFDSRRVKGKRGRGAFGKTIVFGLFKRNGKVYTESFRIVLRGHFKASFEEGWPILESVLYSPWRGYQGLVDVGYGKHFGWNLGKINLYLEPPIPMESKDSGVGQIPS